MASRIGWSVFSRGVTLQSVLGRRIDEPLFRPRIGTEFRLDRIDQAMTYQSTDGARALQAQDGRVREAKVEIAK